MQRINRSIKSFLNKFLGRKEKLPDPTDRWLRGEITTYEYLNLMKWRCNVCGEYRPNKLISVVTHDIGEKHGAQRGVVYRNVKYCNDKLECFEGAHILDRWT